MTKAEKNRFSNLLELARSSKFDGERKNALSAARRIADKYAMSLDELARWEPTDWKTTPTKNQRNNFPFGDNVAGASAVNEHSAELDKARWQSAVEKAKRRGLDRSKNKKGEKSTLHRNINKAKRAPVKHAEVLLNETSLSFQEIADITELDFYQIVGLKLKLRASV